VTRDYWVVARFQLAGLIGVARWVEPVSVLMEE
jgi:hypothetical protein